MTASSRPVTRTRLSRNSKDLAAPTMADTTLDIIAMGDAIVDVIASAEPEFLTRHNLPIGSMQLLTPEQADELYAAMGTAREMSGGSAANSIVCFLLGVTSVDPMKHDLLFSRFVSAERDEPRP